VGSRKGNFGVTLGPGNLEASLVQCWVNVWGNVEVTLGPFGGVAFFARCSNCIFANSLFAISGLQ
jgi:hypothetical protein